MQEQRATSENRNGIAGTRRVLKQCATILGAFYAGLTIGYHQGELQPARYLRSTTHATSNPSIDDKEAAKLYTKQDLDAMVQRRIDLFTKLHSRGDLRLERVKAAGFPAKTEVAQKLHQTNAVEKLPTKSIEFAAAMSNVNRGADAPTIPLHATPENGHFTNTSTMDSVEEIVQTASA